MFRIIISIFLSCLLFSCGSSLPKYEYPENTTIALVYHNDTSKLCYGYIGATVFGNESVNYALDIKIKSHTLKSFKSIASQNGHNFLYLDKNEFKKVGEYFTFSSWDGKPTLKDGKKAKLKEIMVNNQIDILLFESIYNNKKCDVRYSADILNKKGIVYPKRVYVGFKGKDLEYIGSNKGLGGVYVGFQPKTTGSLTGDEIKKLTPFIYRGINYGIRDLFKELNLGEFDYEEQHLSNR